MAKHKCKECTLPTTRDYYNEHVRRMKMLGLHYVAYNTFYKRLVISEWSVQKAITTPAVIGKMTKKRKRRIKREFKWKKIKRAILHWL